MTGHNPEPFDAQASEDSFAFHREYETQTVAAFVSANLDVLVVEFYEWFRAASTASVGFEDALVVWEAERFRRELPPGAHGMLMAAVKSRTNERHDLSAATAAYRADPPRKDEKFSETLMRLAATAYPDVALRDGGPVRSMPEAKDPGWLPYKDPPENGPAWTPPRTTASTHPADAPDAEREPDPEPEPTPPTEEDWS